MKWEGECDAEDEDHESGERKRRHHVHEERLHHVGEEESQRLLVVAVSTLDQETNDDFSSITKVEYRLQGSEITSSRIVITIETMMQMAVSLEPR